MQPWRDRGLVLVGGAAALWGTSGLTATVAYGRGVGPLTVAVWRMGLGAGALLVALSLRSGRATDAEVVAIRAFGHAEGWRLAVVAVGLAAYQASYFVAVDRAGVRIATLITLRSAPLLVTVGERLITPRRTGRRTVAGIGLALTGLVAPVGTPAAASPEAVAGAVFAVGSALGYTTVTLVGGRLGPSSVPSDSPPLRSWAQRRCWSRSRRPRPASASRVTWSCSAPSSTSVWCRPRSPTGCSSLDCRGSTTQAAVLVLLEPLVATALALLLLGERLTLLGSARQ